ncbi:MAG: hypothetical protein KDB90_13330 [Planctomycetes bacterium]|nr:hypothetical protein [Planctomycetota bacterium]
MVRFMLLLAFLMPLALSAQEAYGVGDEIDDHSVEHWINPPAWTEFSDLRGDVVVFKKWGCT